VKCLTQNKAVHSNLELSTENSEVSSHIRLEKEITCYLDNYNQCSVECIVSEKVTFEA
jgi:hypothetical protein